MPYSYNTTVSSGTTSTIAVTFPFLSRDHVHVLLDGLLLGDDTILWVNDGLIDLGSIPAAGKAIKVYRDTPKNVPLVTFPESTGPMNARDLNRAFLQQLYVAQENYDIGVFTSDQLAETTQYINESIAAIEDANEAGAANAASAAASAATASGYAGQATLASRWASAPEDEPVGMGTPPGSFSARHWAAKAESVVFGDIGATSVDFTPDSGIAATNAQDAIVEVYDESARVGIPAVLFDADSAMTGSRVLTDSTQVTVDVSDAGLLKLHVATASEAEAKAGTDADKVLTPATGAAAVDAAVRKLLCGTMFRVPATAAPPGAQVLNGSLLLRADFPDLWAFADASGNIVAEASWNANKAAFSTGDGSTTFRLPDRRGYFERNYVAGGTVDSGRDIKVPQASANLSHTHTGSVDVGIRRMPGSGYTPWMEDPSGPISEGSNPKSLTINASGGTEARPVNMASLLCIWDGTVPA